MDLEEIGGIGGLWGLRRVSGQWKVGGLKEWIRCNRDKIDTTFGNLKRVCRLMSIRRLDGLVGGSGRREDV